MGIFGSSEDRNARRERVNQLENALGDHNRELESIDLALREHAKDVQRRQGIQNAIEAKKWQYQLLDDVQLDDLDKLGKIGWELVGATSFTTGFGIGGNSSMKVHVRYVFKRQIATLNIDEDEIAQVEAWQNRRSEIVAEIKGLKDQA